MDKELIEYMSNKLQQHEDPYVEGAWERFATPKEEKKAGIIWWPYWSAVAVILLVVGALFYGNEFNKNTSNKKVELVKNPTYQSEKEVEIPQHSSTIEKNENTSSTLQESSSTVVTALSKPSFNKNNQVLANSSFVDEVPNLTPNHNLANIQSSVVLDQPQLVNPLKVSITAPSQRTKSRKLTFEEILERDSKIAAAQESTKGRKKDKLKPDVYVASTMGNDNKVNMNYGFSLSYPIANKLSLSSGIAYAAMSTQQDNNLNAADIAADAAPVSMSFASKTPVQTSKNLESVNARLTGLSIPLDLKYQLSKNIYAGIGISAVAVLTTNQQNVYNVTQVKNETFANASGLMENRPLILSSTESETQPESVTQSQDILGFYNFSFGYKQKISNKTNIGLEPFFRVPMKGFSKDNLNLTNGGLRLKFDF